MDMVYIEIVDFQQHTAGLASALLTI